MSFVQTFTSKMHGKSSTRHPEDFVIVSCIDHFMFLNDYFVLKWAELKIVWTVKRQEIKIFYFFSYMS